MIILKTRMSRPEMFNITTRHRKCIDEAIWQAEKSPCAHKHGCVISGSGKILGRGYNNYRTYSSDGMIGQCCTCHAEVAAIRQCLRGGRCFKKYYERCKQRKKEDFYESHTICG